MQHETTKKNVSESEKPSRIVGFAGGMALVGPAPVDDAPRAQGKRKAEMIALSVLVALIVVLCSPLLIVVGLLSKKARVWMKNHAVFGRWLFKEVVLAKP